MPTYSQNNKRIAVNTLLMYIRMFITMVVGLYTSRVVLQTLGVIDYGLYNVVGGIVTMFTFINGAMINATTRFITFYLGKKDDGVLNTVFNMASVVHLVLGIVIVFLGETVGLWFLHSKMQIPPDRMQACFWLLQFSIATTFFNILYVPYNACVIAHEKMSAFAYISIMDVFLKLGIVLSLQWVTADRLIAYGGLLSLVGFLDLCIYFAYCKKRFAETKLRRIWNKPLFKEILSFAGWGMFGNFSYVFYSQGVNILLNVFCGPVVNAARGVAVQVEGVVKQFANNVQTAINPQIIKSYASGEINRTFSLVFASSRYCFYLLFLLSLPIMIEAEFILNLWLGVGSVPAHTVNFIRFILCTSILDAFINPMFTANLASGKLKLYQIYVCGLSYIFMIITYFAIKLTNIPESVFLCIFILTCIGVGARLFVLHRQINLPVGLYIQKVLFKVFIVVVVSIVLPLVLHQMLEIGWLRFIVCSLISVLSVAFAVYALGLDSKERSLVVAKIREQICV
ncbi:lipopolysaccharide biosynthesis protein [Fibrobacter sp.]|uniref:lipopolysaccharide biosynthesis protein n=1 Tax=Fibrobacter sp. TaxID=35828 RepID=UPI00386AC96D